MDSQSCLATRSCPCRRRPLIGLCFPRWASARWAPPCLATAWCGVAHWSLPACVPATRWCSACRQRWPRKGAASLTRPLSLRGAACIGATRDCCWYGTFFAGSARADSYCCNRNINKQSITMNLFFEESGDFKVGTVLSQAGEAYQVEMASGKRTKVKTKDVLLQFEKPAPAELLEQAKSIAADIDLDFLWEVAGEDEFGFAELGAEYFGHAPLPAEAAGLVLSLHSAPVYFYKKGRGRYKAAPEASLKAALAGIEKKKQQALVQAGYVEELKQNRLPASMQPMVLQLLFKPDKNTVEYKALEAACTELHTTPARLMLAVGGVAKPKDLHLSKFLFENFPKGAGFPAVPVPVVTNKLPLAEVAAFSIDDVTTTEIDDAFSVQPLPDGKIKVGIHIAAHGLGIRPDDVIDKMARQRMSTVYMPGDKITMLPDEVVNAFTLARSEERRVGKEC